MKYGNNDKRTKKKTRAHRNMTLITNNNNNNNNDDKRRSKNTMEHEGGGDTSCNWCTRYNCQRLGNKRTSGDYSNYSIIKIDQNTEKSPGNLTCCHSNSSGKPTVKAGVKNSQRSNNNDNDDNNRLAQKKYKTKYD